MSGLIHYHPALIAVICYYIFSAAISSLPSPTASSSVFYVWFFKFSNTIAANLSRAFNTAVESSPNFKAAVQLAGSPLTGGLKT